MAMLMEIGFEAGAKVLTAKAYDASWTQAMVFTVTDLVVSIAINQLIPDSYIQNTRQLCFAYVVIETISGLTGVLMTRLFCENAIHWKQALAAHAISDTATCYVCSIFRTPVLLKKA
jgi:hypothetical protein